jgi:hypothetical protein
MDQTARSGKNGDIKEKIPIKGVYAETKSEWLANGPKTHELDIADFKGI